MISYYVKRNLAYQVHKNLAINSMKFPEADICNSYSRLPSHTLDYPDHPKIQESRMFII